MANDLLENSDDGLAQTRDCKNVLRDTTEEKPKLDEKNAVLKLFFQITRYCANFGTDTSVVR
jgi:hypothetical protein